MSFELKFFRPCIEDLGMTDLYKLSMLQAFLHKHPTAEGRYDFVNRGTPEFPLAELYDDVVEQVNHLCTLRFSDEFLEKLAQKPYFKPDFIEFLRLFQLQRRFIHIWADGEKLCIQARGPVVHAMLFEIYILAIVNECYFRRLKEMHPEVDFDAYAQARLDEKIAMIENDPEAQDMWLYDFGLRRREAGFRQEWMVRSFAERLPRVFRGTSNVYLAFKLGLTAIGTMAHEWIQAHQGLGYRLVDSQRMAFENWAAEYRGDLGIALTDTIGIDAFLRDFDLYLSKLFDGVRHDSGDPITWGERMIAHYESMGIDPRTKRLVFSDGLTIEKGIALHKHFKGRIGVSICIGTFLSCDTPFKALNIVMKLMEVNGNPVAKLSDAPGKTLCEDEGFLTYLRKVYRVQAQTTIELPIYTLTGPRVLESTVNYLKRVAEKGGTYAILDRPTFEALAKVAPAYVDYTPDDAFLGKPFLGKFNGLAILEPPTGA